MKKLPLLSTSLLLGSLVISSCSSNKMAASSANDNLYFMASDVKLATQYAVENNNPQSFKNIAAEPTIAEENFSSRNVNPEYISRYQATTSQTNGDNGVVYFDETAPAQNSVGNVNAYDNYYAAGEGQNFNTPNVNFNFGLGFGFSPWGWGMSPYMGFGWGYPMGGWSMSIGMGFGWGNPYWGMGGFWGPSYGWGMPIYPVYPVYPVYPGYPSYILPGGEYGNRRVVYGARPTRGSAITNTGMIANEAGVMPSTARAQNRANASRLTPSGASARTSSRDFSSSQNDYYNSGRSRVTNTRNVNSAASDRAVSTRPNASVPSARPSSSDYSTRSTSRGGYVAPSSTEGRSASPSYNTRSTSPSYNRSTAPSYNNRSTAPSYNRGGSSSYDRSSTPSYDRSSSPSRSNSGSGFSAPSRMSPSGGSFSAPSRSSSGFSGGGGSTGGSRGGRGN